MENLFNNKNVTEKSAMKPALRKEGCYITNLSKDDKSNLVIEFRDHTGSTLRHVEWKPEKRETDTDEQFEKSVKLTVSRVKHIAGRFMSEDDANTIQGADWDGYVDSFITKMTSVNYKTVPVALKVTLRKGSDDKWYSSLPKVPSFISSEKYPKEFTTNPDWDMYEVPSAGATSPDAAAFQAGGGSVSDF